MRVIAGILLLVAAALAENACPPEQIVDWTIEKLLPHERCDKFYKCTHGKPVEMDCPKGLFYNENTLECDWPSEVNCSDRELPLPEGEIDVINAQSVKVKSESTAPELVDLNANGCPVDPTVHWLTPHENNCTLFYACVWNEKILRECPDGLHFNRVLQLCDWPVDAGCVSSLNKHLPRRLMFNKR